jgi:hypothetical protein
MVLLRLLVHLLLVHLLLLLVVVVVAVAAAAAPATQGHQAPTGKAAPPPRKPSPRIIYTPNRLCASRDCEWGVDRAGSFFLRSHSQVRG